MSDLHRMNEPDQAEPVGRIATLMERTQTIVRDVADIKRLLEHQADRLVATEQAIAEIRLVQRIALGIAGVVGAVAATAVNWIIALWNARP